MINLALAGFGGFGWNLIQRIGEQSEALGCRLIAAADTRLSELPEHCEQLTADGVELFDDALTMFDRMKGRCQAVYIATSIQSHRKLAIAAAEMGYHIHLEKPPAATVQDVDAIAEAVDRAGVLCLVGFQAVHGNDCRFVKDRVVDGRLGEIKHLSCYAGWPRPASYYARNEWAGKLRTGSSWVLDGPATNALSHQVNNLLHLASREPRGYAAPTAVRAELYAAGPLESHNLAAIEMQTDCGPTAHCLLAHCSEAEKFWGPTIVVEGTAGRAEWEIYHDVVVTYADGTTESCTDARDDQAEMLANFFDAIRSGDGSALRCTLGESRKMILALNAAHESSGRIHRIEGDVVQNLPVGEGDSRVLVQGLDDLLRTAGREGRLFSDLDPTPAWAVRTEPFDLAGYESFPQRFSCD